MELKGYGTNIRLADGILAVEAINGVARGALGAASREIPVSEIVAVEFKAPSFLSNGMLIVQSGAGVTMMHFLKKSSVDAQALYAELLKVSGINGSTKVTGSLANEQLDAWRTRIAEDLSASQHRLDESRKARREEYAAWKREHGAARERQREDQRKLVAEKFDATATRSIETATVASLLDAAEEGDIADIDVSAPLPDAGSRTVAEVVSDLLDLASSAAAAGDIVLEEQHVANSVLYAKKVGRRAERKDTSERIRLATQQGRLRIGSQFVGVVAAESALAQWARKGSLLSVQFGDEKRIEIRSDRIIAGSVARVVDEFTSAQVYSDGQTQVLMRPTLTRMALLSPLPGSALIPGLAFQKKSTVDTRTAEFQIGSVGWNLRVTIPPENVNSARSIAEQVNRLAGALEKAGMSETADHQSASASSAIDAALSQLERMYYLQERGVISAEEADRLRASILE